MAPTSHTIDDIKRLLGIDAAEIAQRRAFFGIDEATGDHVHALHALFAADNQDLAGDFYDHLLDQPELQALLGDSATLERLRRSLRRYFQTLTGGDYGDAYVEERLRVGLVHHHVGLAPKWYIGAYRLYLSRLLPALAAHSADDAERLLTSLDALLRLVFFDMSLALETYHGAHLHERETANIKLEEARREAIDLASTYSAILDALPSNLALVDEHTTIVAVNEGWRRFAAANGYRGDGYGVGSSYVAVCEAAADEGAEDARAIATGIGMVLRGETRYFAHEYPCHSPQEKRWFRAIVTPVDLRGRPGAVAMHVNITDRKEREQTLWRSANYDALTDIPNRVLILDRLTHAISLAKRSDHLVALLFIDFDRFKLVNDLLGHAAGDEILRVIARRLEGCLREQDSVGRISGDEFIVILPNLKRPDEATTVARKLLAATSRPIDYNGQETFITCSIGIALAPDDSEDAEQLVRMADAAMYRSKQAGRNRILFYTGDVQVGSAGRLQLESDLRRALEQREFEIHYQAKADIASGRIKGAEALLRWRHPTRGLIAPGDFIPLLEETGLIQDVGLWVIEEVCANIFSWQQLGLNPGRIAINVSPLQLQQEEFVAEVGNILSGTDIPANALEFEITESYLLHNAESAARQLEDLHRYGIEFAIDDFGTGYSNLGYLRQLPIHTIKVDRSFTRNIPDDTDNAVLTSAIILMAQRLQLQIVAEGVENERQLEFLKRNGCDILQGYLYSRPLPEADFREFVAASRTLSASRAATAAAPRIVVVHPDPAVLAELEELVELEGHRVCCVLRPEAVTALLVEGRVLAVISGHQPPAFNGITLLAQLRQVFPETRRLLVVDHLAGELLREAINLAAVHKVLTRSASVSTLARELRDTLHSPAGGEAIEP